MSLALYMDEHVHRSITSGLRLRQVDVLTIQEDGRAGLPDPLVLDRASELERILFTQDEDFLAEAHYRQQQGISFPGVIYAHQLVISIGDCIRDLELIAKVGELEDLANSVRYLPL